MENSNYFPPFCPTDQGKKGLTFYTPASVYKKLPLGFDKKSGLVQQEEVRKMKKPVFREADLFGSNENFRELPPVHDTEKTVSFNK